MKILVCEDDSAINYAISNVVKNWVDNTVVYTAKDGTEMLEILKNTPIDVVITDIMMPHLDGIAATKILRNCLDINVPVIAVTGLSEKEFPESEKYLFYKILRKPIYIVELIKILKEIRSEAKKNELPKM